MHRTLIPNRFRLIASFIAAALIVWQSVPGPAQEQGWARFRGPNGSGVDDSIALDTELDLKKALWQVSLAGDGNSSPIVMNDTVIACGYQSTGEFHVQALALDDGRELWRWSTKVDVHPMHRLNHMASSTPATDGERLFVLVPEAEHMRLHALNRQGEVEWSHDFGRWTAQHGFGMSPMICDDLVIVVNSQEPHQGLPAPGTSEVIALRVNDGEIVWRAPLSGDRACYSVPVVFRDGQKVLLLNASTGEGLYALDVLTGKRTWNEPALSLRVVGSPVLHGNRLFANNGSGGGGNFLVGLDVTATPPKVRFEQHRAMGYVPTVIVANGLLFSPTDSGMVTCLDPETGEERWTERVSSGFWSSPVSDGRSLFCLDKDGVMHVIAADGKFEEIGRFPLGEPSKATPAIHHGHLIIRTDGHLYCFKTKT
jgi:outer membrane protein assembly factor BamB